VVVAAVVVVAAGAVVLACGWDGVEAAVTVVVPEPQPASGTAHASVSRAAADARRVCRLGITSMVFAARSGTPRFGT